MAVRILNADCLTALPQLAAEGVRAHCVVTDPPYHLTTGKKGGSGPASVNLDSPYGRARITTGFMGQAWDGGDVALRAETWAAVRECMLPGAHLLAFGGTRTFHRMACAIEDAGFEIRDTIMWVYGSGFPKSLDVSKAIDKAAGAERAVVGSYTRRDAYGDPADSPTGDGRNMWAAGSVKTSEVDITAPATPEAAAWSGWGTALKPAWEPIIVARKPLCGTVAVNVLAHGCGALNIDACRVPTDDVLTGSGTPPLRYGGQNSRPFHEVAEARGANQSPLGRWPANVIHDGSPEVEEAFAAFGEKSSGAMKAGTRPNGARNIYGQDGSAGYETAQDTYADTGSASRFFYTAKADATDRAGSKHPTVKPTALMRWLVQLVCPPGGLVLDPFAGSGSTGLAADQLGFDAILIERDPTYAADARRKIASDAPLLAEVAD